jgi:hypothetical protein
MNKPVSSFGRIALLMTLLLSVMLQGFIPAGFMPSFDKQATIVICTPSGTKTIAVDAHQAPHHNADDEAKLCPFAPVIFADAPHNPPQYIAHYFEAGTASISKGRINDYKLIAHSYLSQGPPTVSL